MPKCPNLYVRCWRVDNDGFRTTIVWQTLPYVVCGLCDTKEIGGSLMELTCSWDQRTNFTVFVWLDACSRRHPFDVFCCFYWQSLRVAFFEKGLYTFYFVSFSFPFLIKFFTSKKKKKSITINPKVVNVEAQAWLHIKVCCRTSIVAVHVVNCCTAC